MAVYVMATRGGKTLTIFLAADLKKFDNGLRDAKTGLSGLSGTMKNLLGPAAIGAGIAVAGLATAMAVDGVKAAAEDEVSLAKLTQTLENLKLAHSTEEIDTFIDALEQSVGYLGDLRPAYDRLIRSTKDAAQANSLLSLSLDVAAGTGKSVEAVAEALGKAYDGNTGALGRLGAGIDKATIASGDMQAITSVLAETFGGQAAAQADTLNGRMQKLQRASEQLTEAFGQGLLKGIKDTTEGTDDLVRALENAEPVMEKLGEATADVGEGAVNVATNFTALGTAIGSGRWDLVRKLIFATDEELADLNQEVFAAAKGFESVAEMTNETAKALGYTNQEARNAVPQWNALTGAIRMTTQQYIDYLNANQVGNQILKDANADYQDLAARQARVNTFTYEYTGVQTKATTATGGASAAVEKLTKKQKELIDLHESVTGALDTNRENLAFYTAELQRATDAIDEFTTGMQDNLLAGVDLGAAFTQSKEQGGNIAGGVVAGYEAMINKAEWFGNVLNALKAQGVPSEMIDYLGSQGAEIGGELGQMMLLDQGLLKSLTDNWIRVQEKTKELSMSLVPEFLTAGQESALEMVDSISETMAKQVTRLGRIGKQIAKPLGQSFKAQLMAEVAAALREVEAAGAAGRAEAVATAERKQVALTNAAVAQALQNLVRSADARNGAPIAPVLS